MLPTTGNYSTPPSGCRYCGRPCPGAHCSWEHARFDRQSESTWRRNAAGGADWHAPKLVAS